MLILPLIWQSLATLATVLLVTVGNGISVFVDMYKPLHATIGHGSTWFKATIGEVYGLSIRSSDVPGMNARSFYDIYYIPPPVIDPFLVDLTLLDVQYPQMDGEAEDEEGPIARFEWAMLDVDGVPEKVMRFKPAEHVTIPLVFHIRSISFHLFGFDPAPTPFYGYWSLFIVFLWAFYFADTCYWLRLRRQGREYEYWRLLRFPPRWAL